MAFVDKLGGDMPFCGYRLLPALTIPQESSQVAKKSKILPFANAMIINIIARFIMYVW